MPGLSPDNRSDPLSQWGRAPGNTIFHSGLAGTGGRQWGGRSRQRVICRHAARCSLIWSITSSCRELVFRGLGWPRMWEAAQVPPQSCEAGTHPCSVGHLAHTGSPSWHLVSPPSPCHVPATTASSSPQDPSHAPGESDCGLSPCWAAQSS